MRLLFLLVILSPMLSAQNVLTYKALAIDAKTKKAIFSGVFKETYSNDDLQQIETFYYLPNDKKLAAYRKANFTQSQYTPSYRFENYKTGSIELINPFNDNVSVEFKKNRDKSSSFIKLKVPGIYVVDAGLVQLIRKNWTALEGGKTLSFNIVVAQRLDYYNFMLRNKSTAEDITKGYSRFYFESTHWLIRQLVDPIVLVFDNKEKLLRKYEGTTNLSDENGDLFLKAIISYQYEN